MGTITLQSSTKEKTLVVNPSSKLTITRIEIDNNSSNSATITLSDVYTPTPTPTNPTPEQKSVVRKVITSKAGEHLDISKLNITIFGVLSVVSTIDDTNINITISYKVD